MSKAKQNTFLTAYFAILAAGAVGLGYVAWSSWSGATEAKDDYETKKKRLGALQKAPIFPKPENVEAKKKQVDAYAAKVSELNESIRAFQTPLATEMNNSELQSKLQKTRDALVVDAKNAGVNWPDTFDLGMGTYLSTFPETSAVPRLNAWMEGIQSFVTILFNSGVKEINSVSRLELEFEKKDNSGKPEDAPKAKTPPKPTTATKGKKADAAPVVLLEEKAVLERYPFSFTFTCSSRSLNEVLTALANSSPDPQKPYFFNIRSLRIENEQKTGAETSTQVQLQEGIDESNQKPFKRDSIFIFGVEKNQVHLGLDLIRFTGPEMADSKK